jgi:hypothetical protein
MDLLYLLVFTKFEALHIKGVFIWEKVVDFFTKLLPET